MTSLYTNILTEGSPEPRRELTHVVGTISLSELVQEKDDTTLYLRLQEQPQTQYVGRLNILLRRTERVRLHLNPETRGTDPDYRFFCGVEVLDAKEETTARIREGICIWKDEIDTEYD